MQLQLAKRRSLFAHIHKSCEATSIQVTALKKVAFLFWFFLKTNPDEKINDIQPSKKHVIFNKDFATSSYGLKKVAFLFWFFLKTNPVEKINDMQPSIIFSLF